jgi:hypothetical protein
MPYIGVERLGRTRLCAALERQVAQQLQTAMSEAEARGTTVQMVMPAEAGLDDREPNFYAAPQPAMPLKDYRDAGRLVYQQPDTAS